MGNRYPFHLLSEAGAIEETMCFVVEQGQLARSALARLGTTKSPGFLDAMIDVASSLDMLPGTGQERGRRPCGFSQALEVTLPGHGREESEIEIRDLASSPLQRRTIHLL